MGLHREIIGKVGSSLEKLQEKGLCKSVNIGQISDSDNDFLDGVFEGLRDFGIAPEALMTLWKYIQEDIQKRNALGSIHGLLSDLLSGERPKKMNREVYEHALAKAMCETLAKIGIEKTIEEAKVFIHDDKCDKCDHQDECNKNCDD